MSPGPERAVARVDTAAISANCARLGGLLAPATELCAVVKADAYGHGREPAARAALAGGATWLGVATAAEAAALREEGLDERVLVMGALTRAEAAVAVAARADVVVWRPELLGELAGLADGADAPVRVHVKLDTGMGRLGSKDAEAAARLADRIDAEPALELAGVMTHFATADDIADDGHFAGQLEAFRAFVDDVRERHPRVIAHAANSAAAYRDPASHFDLVRCGIAVYGLDPFGGDPADHGLEPALSLESYVADVKRFAPGDSAGYGRRWSAEEESWVGVVPIGYGDGVRRGLSNNADLLVHGRRQPVVGTVSMDNLTIWLGRETDVEPGDRAVLIGAQGGERIRCEELAERLDTINYEIPCGLTGRVRRAYEGG